MDMSTDKPRILELEPGDEIDEATANRTPLVGFNLSGSRPPLILLRCWKHEVDQYRNLALHLGFDQPIVTASPPRVEPGVDLPLQTDAWVDCFTGLLGSHLDRDDLILGGWSYSGIVALAIGERLAVQGRPPKLINLIDSIMPVAKAVGDARKRGGFHKFVIQVNRGLELQDPETRKAFFKRYAELLLRRFMLRRREDAGVLKARLAGKLPAPQISSKRIGKQKNPPPIEPLKRAIRIRYLKHRPTLTGLPIALYWTEQSQRKLGDVSLGWSTRALGILHCSSIAGSHASIFDDENIEVLATAMKEELRLAENRKGLVPKVPGYGDDNSARD